jgi:hypothetical protein
VTRVVGVLGVFGVLGVQGALGLPGPQVQPPRDTRPVSAATATATIAGVVTTDDAQPRPLRRARVVIAGAGLEMPRSTITGDDGRFAFDRIPAGRFSVSAAKDGYVGMSHGATRPGRPGAGVQVADGQQVALAIRLPHGAVITGTVLDVDGQPAAGILVFALSHRFFGAQGDFRYVATGMPNPSITDDRGVYRIFGLPAGDYFISAQPQLRQGGNPGGELRVMSRGEIGDRSVAYSQVFHPSATEITRAARITVRAGEERPGVDVQLQYVPLATIRGIAPTAGGPNSFTLTMARTDQVQSFDPIRTARPDAAGHFTIPAVPPGQYIIISRVDRKYAFGDVVVTGDDVDNVVVTEQQPLSIAGELRFEGETPPAVLPPQMRTGLPLFMPIATARISPASAVIDGLHFKIEDAAPGSYRLQLNTPGLQTPIGKWWLKSIVIAGHDVLDAPIELRQAVDGAVVTFAGRASELAGTLRDAEGAPVSEQYVVVFSADRAHWFFNSRRVVGVRPRDGQWVVRNLPPGDYRVAAGDLDQYDWFDSAVLERLFNTATPVRIVAVEKQTLNLIVR